MEFGKRKNLAVVEHVIPVPIISLQILLETLFSNHQSLCSLHTVYQHLKAVNQ